MSFMLFALPVVAVLALGYFLVRVSNVSGYRNESLNVVDRLAGVAGVLAAALWFGVAGMVPLSLGYFSSFALFVLTGTAVAAIALPHPKASIGMGALGMAVLIGGSFLTSAEMLHAERYHALLGKELQTPLDQHLPPIDIDQAPLVSEDMAHLAMEKRLAEVPALGSQVTLGTPVKQLYRGKLVWVSFLEHRGFFKAMSNSTTPGYVMVSAVNPSEVHLVQTLQGKPLALRYLPSGWFNDNVERHAWLNGFASTGLTDFTAEIDEDGRPFYVATAYENTIGLSGADAKGVVTIDAQNGETKFYSTAQVPAWVDRVQPMEFVRDQVADRGHYVNGWLNPSDKARLRVSGHVDLVYSRERAYWMVGLTSVGRDSGLVGFMLIDSKTKEVHRFTLPAVTEDVAAKAVENVNPEKHYTATNPLPFIVEGVPTYVMALRDTQGIARAYGMVSMQNHQVLATGETLSATLRNYESKMTSNKTAADIASDVKMQALKAKVVRIASEVRGSTTHYFLVLETTEASLQEALFTGTSDLSEELVLTQAGDTVELEYAATRSRVKALTKFDNTDIKGR